MLRSADRYVELAITALDAAKERRERESPSDEDLIEAEGLETFAVRAERRERDVRQQIADLRDQQVRVAQKGTYVAQRFELGADLIGLLGSTGAGGDIDASAAERLKSAMQRLDLELADL